MMRNILLCLILITAVLGCGKVHVNIDPKSSTLPIVQASAKSSIEVTSGSSLKQVTSGGYKVTASVGPVEQINQTTTPNGYKVRVGVTGLVAYTQ